MRITTPLAFAALAAVTSAAVAFRGGEDWQGDREVDSLEADDPRESFPSFGGSEMTYGGGEPSEYDGGIYNMLAARSHEDKSKKHEHKGKHHEEKGHEHRHDHFKHHHHKAREHEHKGMQHGHKAKKHEHTAHHHRKHADHCEGEEKRESIKHAEHHEHKAREHHHKAKQHHERAAYHYDTCHEHDKHKRHEHDHKRKEHEHRGEHKKSHDSGVTSRCYAERAKFFEAQGKANEYKAKWHEAKLNHKEKYAIEAASEGHYWSAQARKYQAEDCGAKEHEPKPLVPEPYKPEHEHKHKEHEHPKHKEHEHPKHKEHEHKHKKEHKKEHEHEHKHKLHHTKTAEPTGYSAPTGYEPTTAPGYGSTTAPTGYETPTGYSSPTTAAIYARDAKKKPPPPPPKHKPVFEGFHGRFGPRDVEGGAEDDVDASDYAELDFEDDAASGEAGEGLIARAMPEWAKNWGGDRPQGGEEYDFPGKQAGEGDKKGGWFFGW